MEATVLVGTQKGAVVLRRGAAGGWSSDGLQLKGWLVTAFARDAAGRSLAAVTHDVYGAAVMASDDLSHWEQLEAAPRYRPEQTGNPGHNRVVGAMDPMQRFSAEARHVDQIWKLLAAGDRLYAGVSEAGLFFSDDGGASWHVCRGIDEHPDRKGWVPGFGGLCLHTILVDGNDPGRVWVGISSAGAFRSEDGGETFHSINEGVVPGGPCDVFFGTTAGSVYGSLDGGESWERLAADLPKVLCVSAFAAA